MYGGIDYQASHGKRTRVKPIGLDHVLSTDVRPPETTGFESASLKQHRSSTLARGTY